MNVALIQAQPVYLNLEKSLEKVADLTAKAAREGAELVVFGETWLTGYPAWLDHCPNVAVWDHEPTKEVFVKMYENGFELGSKAHAKLGEIARQHQVYLCIGVNEVISTGRGNGTIYNALLIFNPLGSLELHHRKLTPTYTEKMLYGQGDGHGLHSINTPKGKIGGLICWEHWIPLCRQAMHNSNEYIHIALWPKVHERHLIASRHYAFEGRCFVLSVGQLMDVKAIPGNLDLPKHLKGQPDKLILDGGSCIIKPDGNYLLEPQYGKEEIYIHEIPPVSTVIKERMTLDTSGHYNRWDVFSFNVNRDRK